MFMHLQSVSAARSARVERGGGAGAEKLTGKALMRARLDRAKRGGVTRTEQAGEDTRAGTGLTGGGKRKHADANVSIWLRTAPPQDMVMPADMEEQRGLRATWFANNSATGNALQNEAQNIF